MSLQLQDTILLSELGSGSNLEKLLVVLGLSGCLFVFIYYCLVVVKGPILGIFD